MEGCIRHCPGVTKCSHGCEQAAAQLGDYVEAEEQGDIKVGKTVLVVVGIALVVPLVLLYIVVSGVGGVR